MGQPLQRHRPCCSRFRSFNERTLDLRVRDPEPQVPPHPPHQGSRSHTSAEKQPAPKATVTPKAALTLKSSGANPTPLSYRRPKDRMIVTASQRHRITQLGVSRTVGNLGVWTKQVQIMNPSRFRKKPRTMMPQSFPVLPFRHQVHRIRISQTFGNRPDVRENRSGTLSR